MHQHTTSFAVLPGKRRFLRAAMPYPASDLCRVNARLDLSLRLSSNLRPTMAGLQHVQRCADEMFQKPRLAYSL